MAKQKTKVYDFRKVSMEVEIGVFQEPVGSSKRIRCRSRWTPYH